MTCISSHQGTAIANHKNEQGPQQSAASSSISSCYLGIWKSGHLHIMGVDNTENDLESN